MSNKDYFKYNDSSLYVWRKGTPEDPFVERIETVKVVNNRALLVEIPDPYSRVDIEGMDEIDDQDYRTKKHPDEGSYIVNYGNGYINFHPSMNGEDVEVSYMSRGKILFPASRIWIDEDNPYAVATLADFVKLSIEGKDDLIDAINLADSELERLTNETESSLNDLFKDTNETLDDFVSDNEERFNNLYSEQTTEFNNLYLTSKYRFDNMIDDQEIKFDKWDSDFSQLFSDVETSLQEKADHYDDEILRAKAEADKRFNDHFEESTEQMDNLFNDTESSLSKFLDESSTSFEDMIDAKKDEFGDFRDKFNSFYEQSVLSIEEFTDQYMSELESTILNTQGNYILYEEYTEERLDGLYQKTYDDIDEFMTDYGQAFDDVLDYRNSQFDQLNSDFEKLITDSETELDTFIQDFEMELDMAVMSANDRILIFEEYTEERIEGFYKRVERDLEEFLYESDQEFNDLLDLHQSDMDSLFIDTEDRITNFMNDHIEYLDIVMVDLQDKFLMFEEDVEERLDGLYEKTKRRFTNFLDESEDTFDSMIYDQSTRFESFYDKSNYRFEDFMDYIRDMHDIEMLNAQDATFEAKEMAEYANRSGFYAEREADKVSLAMHEHEISMIESEEATKFATESAEKALDAKDEAIRARNQTILIWKEPVPRYSDLIGTYTSPEIGWTVMLSDSGVVYRYNGTTWVEIGNMSLTTPLASADIDGLMSRNMFVKLDGIEEEAEVNLLGEDAKEVLPDYFRERTICFVIPDELQTGDQGVIIQFPHNGVITDIKSSLGVEGTDDTEIELLRISKDDFINKSGWENILSRNVIIGYGDVTDDGLHDLRVGREVVSKNDYFKINVTKTGIGISDLNVNVTIKI